MEKNFLRVEDIIADESFQGWYYGTDKARAAKWEAVMAANPSLAGLVAEARDIMDSLSLKEKEVSVDQHATAHQRLMQSVAVDEAARPRVVSLKRRRLWYVAAAAVVLLT